MSRRIPEGANDGGYEVRMFMPKYGRINERRNQLHEVIRLSGMNIIIDDTDHPLIIKVATMQPSRMQVYFIDNDDYFTPSATEELETYSHQDDNDERVIFFARGVIETVRKLRWEPAIVHVNGWVSALAPLYIKRLFGDDPSFRSSKIVYSLVGSEPVEPMNPRMAEKLRMEGFEEDDLASIAQGIERPDIDALHRIAIDFADAIVQADPQISPELTEYAKNTGKPFMAFPEDGDLVAAVKEFYNSL